MQPFGEPVEAIKTLLGDCYEREYSGLSILCGLIQTRRPRKIIKVGNANDSTTAAVLSCINLLELPCEFYIVDSKDESRLYGREIFNLKEELEKGHRANCWLFEENSIAGKLDEIGGEIDFFMIDTTEQMPKDVLDFIVGLPYLTKEATIVLCSTFLSDFKSNVLFQNVAVNKASTHFSAQLEAFDHIEYGMVDVVSAIYLNAKMNVNIKDIFLALRCPWSYIPKLDHLLEYASSIRRNYDPECLSLYREAMCLADSNKKMLFTMTQSLLGTFSQVLVYGKGKRGEFFVKLAKIIGIAVTGFVVSDDHYSNAEYMGLPIYSYSQIPFSNNEVFIFQTVESYGIDERLCQSGYHWIKLPVDIWCECDGHYI